MNYFGLVEFSLCARLDWRRQTSAGEKKRRDFVASRSELAGKILILIVSPRLFGLPLKFRELREQESKQSKLFALEKEEDSRGGEEVAPQVKRREKSRGRTRLTSQTLWGASSLSLRLNERNIHSS